MLHGFDEMRFKSITLLTSFQYNIAAIIYVIMHSFIIYVITLSLLEYVITYGISTLCVSPRSHYHHWPVFFSLSFTDSHIPKLVVYEFLFLLASLPIMTALSHFMLLLAPCRIVIPAP
jgi:hypothetical protein